MRELLFVCGALSVAGWLYLLLLHGRFWQIGPCLSPKRATSGLAAPIAIVIPARNEAETIGRVIRSLLNQTCANAIYIYLVDDASTDGTADVARAAAGDHLSKLTVIAGTPLPPRWTGKLWAVQQGIEAARATNPRFLLLTDADVEHASDNVATLVSIAEREGYDLASFMVKLHCRSIAEKLLIPAFVFFFFMLYPPRWIRSSKRRAAGAAGGCILIRPESLEKAGGIAAISSEIIDDCALARAVKKSGGRVWLGMTPDTSSLRTYESFCEIDRMIARTAFNQLHHSTALLGGAMFGMALLYLVPVALLFTGNVLLAALGLAACAIMTASYRPMVCFYRLGFGWGLTLPFAAVFYIGATLHSAVNFWAGRGGEWKGRNQDS